MLRGGKTVGFWGCLAAMMLLAPTLAQAQQAVDFRQAIAREYRVGGWAIGCQVYSFNRYTLFEGIDKTRETGARLIEGFPGQVISEEHQVKFDASAPQEALDAVKKKLDEAGVKMVCYGVVGLGKDEAASRKVFEFARKMGILVIVSEPEEENLPLVAKLAQEYGIPVAIHNHPQPSRYWDPKHLLESIKDLGPWVGSCADTGHWMRSGVDPLEALKMLEGRIISMHIKDLNQTGRGTKEAPTHDVPFGTGKGNMKAILDELRRQKFNGPMSIEYEYNWTESVPEIKQCIDYMRDNPRRPAAAKGEKSEKGEKAGKGGKAARKR
ncbi:sugar phosphate isomerase/epimerase [Candidatus Sumerlaeota bacterium]|nr:sugar phosphate isomerase/epimerase [Candidatus Sumerlaeota bacterium]